MPGSRKVTIGSFPCRLPTVHHPVAVALDLPGMDASAARVEAELGAHAGADRDKCRGYFPTLEGVPGIDSDLPACHAFSSRFPLIRHGGAAYRFNFVRLSLKRQSVDPAYHLDSDRATALSGDVTTLKRRRVLRLMLNLSSLSERTLRYLDVDPDGVDLVTEGSYVRVADPCTLSTRALTAAIPARCGSRVAGLVFAANLVLHSGVDNAHGHFVAAYGIDEPDDTTSIGCPA
jgi:hypothetical protein